MAATMEYNYLGSTGVKVSNLCLGTLTFGTSDKAFVEFYQTGRQADEALANKMMDRFVELGGNFIDTSNLYAFGEAEEIIGNWLKTQRREKIIVASKVRYQTKLDDMNYVGLSRRHLIEACEDSLRRLQTDYIDLYQAHACDNATPIEETLRTFDDLVRCGKIRYYGFSNVCGWQLQKIADTTRSLGLNRCITLQAPNELLAVKNDCMRHLDPELQCLFRVKEDLKQEYNLLDRFNEYETFMVCKNEGMGVLAYSPLKSGLLTDRFERLKVLDSSKTRIGLFDKIGSMGTCFPEWRNFGNNDSYWNIIEEVGNIAKSHGKSIPQVAIRWLLQKDIVSSVMIGFTTMAQLEDNMGASTGWKLTEEEMAKLDELSAPVLPGSYCQMWGGIAGERYNRFNNESIDMKQ